MTRQTVTRQTVTRQTVTRQTVTRTRPVGFTRLAFIALSMLVASPAFAATGGAGQDRSAQATASPDGSAQAAAYPPARRRRRVIRVVRHRRPRVVRRRVVIASPPRVVRRTTIIRRQAQPQPPRSASARADRPISLSLLQRNTVTGVELGIRLSPFVEVNASAGADLQGQPAGDCRGPGCRQVHRPEWSTGVRVFPINARFSPFVSAALMGSFDTVEDTRGLVGGGVGFQAYSGLNINASLEYAIGESDVKDAFKGTLTLGYAF